MDENFGFGMFCGVFSAALICCLAGLVIHGSVIDKISLGEPWCNKMAVEYRAEKKLQCFKAQLIPEKK